MLYSYYVLQYLQNTYNTCEYYLQYHDLNTKRVPNSDPHCTISICCSNHFYNKNCQAIPGDLVTDSSIQIVDCVTGILPFKCLKSVVIHVQNVEEFRIGQMLKSKTGFSNFTLWKCDFMTKVFIFFYFCEKSLKLLLHPCSSTATCKVLLNRPQCKLGQLCATRC